MKNEAIIVFQKNPQRGKVKTRLAAGIGEEAALKIYLLLLELTFKELATCKSEVIVYYSDFLPNPNSSANKLERIQRGQDLGERMKNAFEEIFSLGYKKVIIIGTDCPELTTGHLEKAFQDLDNFDVVIGPAADGGYYLLGMRTYCANLFHQIEWSTSGVLSQTLQNATDFGLSVGFLPLLHDIDDKEDWIRFVTENPEYDAFI
jgi:uncharacterized protein